MEAIIGYTLSDLGLALNAVEEDLPHGGSVRVELCSEQLPSHDAIYDFHLGMVASGAHVSYPEAQVIDGIPTMTFNITKGSPLLLALIPLLPVVIIGGLITFGIFKIESIVSALIPLALILVGGIVIVAIAMRKPAEAVATRYLQGGPGGVKMLGDVHIKGRMKKPTRYDVKVEYYEERGDITIDVTDKRNGKEVARWTGEDAAEMFEQGWFKGGGIGWTRIGSEMRKFENSVVEYLEHLGTLAPWMHAQTMALDKPEFHVKPEWAVPLRDLTDEQLHLVYASSPDAQVNTFEAFVDEVRHGPLGDYYADSRHNYRFLGDDWVPQNLPGKAPFVKVGDKIRYIRAAGNYRGDDWAPGFWVKAGVTGEVIAYHPEEPGVRAGGEFFEWPAYATVRWDGGGPKARTAIDPEDEGSGWQRLGGTFTDNRPAAAGFVRVGDRIKYIGPRRDFSGLGGLSGTITEVYDKPVVWATAKLDNGHGIDIGPGGEGKIWERERRMQPDTDESRILKEYGYLPHPPWDGFLPLGQQVKWIGKDAGKKFGGIGFMLTTGSIGEVLGSPADNPSEIKDGEVMVVWGGYVPLRRSTITPGEKGKKWELFGELLPHIRPGQFVIKQMGPNQVKVSRSDRKGEFFLEFGPPVVPEGPTGAEPASLAGVLASLGLSRAEANLVETGATVRVADADQRAPHLWQMWQDFEAESPPYSTQTGSSPLRPAMPATEVVSLEGVVSKWEQAKARNSVTARRDLESLQRAGVEVDDALDALDNYQGIERSDYEEAEEYSEERTSAWDEFLDALRDLEPPEENDLEAESPPYSTQTGSSPRHAALEAGYRKVITRELGQSVAEEKQAQEVYGKRAHTADAAGDTETGSIYREIAGDEYSHQVGFEQRLEEVQRPKLLPALQPYDEYQFARYVLLNNAFSKEDIPDYSGLSGKNPHGVPAAVWARAMSDMSGQFVKEGNWYKVFNNEVEAPPRMRGRPAYMVGPGGGLPLLPDSREWMAQTIADSGWREKLDAAFEAAIARARS